jgi:hypothetical protein
VDRKASSQSRQLLRTCRRVPAARMRGLAPRAGHPPAAAASEAPRQRTGLPDRSGLHSGLRQDVLHGDTALQEACGQGWRAGPLCVCEAARCV